MGLRGRGDQRLRGLQHFWLESGGVYGYRKPSAHSVTGHTHLFL